MPDSLSEFLLEVTAKHPDRTAFVELADGETASRTLTFEEVVSVAGQRAAWLRETVGPGQTVLLVHAASLEFALSFFACALGGVIPVAAQPPGLGQRHAAISRIRGIASAVGGRIALADGANAELGEELPEIRWLDVEAVPDSGAALVSGRSATDQPAFIQTTSGSTAAPKGVMLSDANLLQQADLLLQATGQGQGSTMVGWAPLHHDMGLVTSVLLPLAGAYRSVLMPPFAFLQRPLRWLRAVTEWGATMSGGPNFAYELAVRGLTYDEREQLDLTRWEVAFIGAEPIRARTLSKFEQAMGPVGFSSRSWFCAWGLAEATCVVTCRDARDRGHVVWFDQEELEKGGRAVPRDTGAPGARPHVACGPALPRHHVLVADPDSAAILEDDLVGELWVRGPCVSSGYRGAPEATEELFGGPRESRLDGYVRTGDLGVVHEGDVFIVGRIKDVLIVNGRRVAPQDIESCTEVTEECAPPGYAAAFSYDDGEAEHVAVVQGVRGVSGPEADEVANRMAAAVSQELGIGAAVHLVRPGAVPRTASGKPRRTAAREALLQGEFNVLGSSATVPAGVDGG